MYEDHFVIDIKPPLGGTMAKKKATRKKATKKATKKKATKKKATKKRRK